MYNLVQFDLFTFLLSYAQNLNRFALVTMLPVRMMVLCYSFLMPDTKFTSFAYFSSNVTSRKQQFYISLVASLTTISGVHCNWESFHWLPIVTNIEIHTSIFSGVVHYNVHRISRIDIFVVSCISGRKRSKPNQVWNIRRRPLVGSCKYLPQYTAV